MNKQQIIKECVRCMKVQIDDIWYHPKHAPARNGASYTGAICDECKEYNKRKEQQEWENKLHRFAELVGAKITRKKDR